MTKRKRNKIKRMLRNKDKKLKRKYPFLIQKYHWYTGKLLPKKEWTVAIKYDIPNGWWKRFGIQMCDDLKRELNRVPFSERNFIIHEAKEKYGSMRIYCSYPTDNIRNILRVYEHISETVCINCGAMDSRMINRGWVCPVCEKCYSKRRSVAYEDGTTDTTLNNDKTPDYYEYKIYRKEHSGWETVRVDISDYIRRLR